MIRVGLVITMSLLLVATANAQGIEPPPHLAGFLSSGMNVGVRAFDETGGIKIVVYTDSDFAIAKDARTLNLDELAAKYEAVAKGVENKLLSLRSSLKERGLRVYGGRAIDRSNIQVYVDRRSSLYKIVHVGNDYILVADPDYPKKRRVFSTRFISTISWHETLRFSTTGLRFVKEEGIKPTDERMPEEAGSAAPSRLLLAALSWSLMQENDIMNSEPLRCPVSTCYGWISFVDDEDGGFWGCGECGEVWRSRDDLNAAIDDILAVYTYRNKMPLQAWPPRSSNRSASELEIFNAILSHASDHCIALGVVVDRLGVVG